jgi:LacI family transcriptional regulator, galactose operon repressor
MDNALNSALKCGIVHEPANSMTSYSEDYAQGNPKSPGIKDIARSLGVSIGTVDRALHSRPGINPLTRARVLKMAQTLGYRPNFAARHLKLNRKLRLFANMPREIAPFFDALRKGIAEAARPFQSTIEMHFRDYPRLGEGDAEIFKQALEEGANGIIIAPGDPAAIKPLIRKAARAHVPVVCVATDAPGTERLTSISTDPVTGGAMVAELMSQLEARPSKVLLVTGDLSTVDHSEKVRGFREFLVKAGSPIEIALVAEAHDDPVQALRLTKEALQAHPGIDAIYVCTANSIPVIQALEEAGRLRRTLVFTTDLFPALIPYLQSRQVFATMYQRPMAQGRMAFQALYQFIVEGICPPLRHRLAPHVVMRSNLDLFLGRVPGELDDSEAPLAAPRKSPHALGHAIT